MNLGFEKIILVGLTFIYFKIIDFWLTCLDFADQSFVGGGLVVSGFAGLGYVGLCLWAMDLWADSLVFWDICF